jgi:hypothetical protein
MTTQSTGVLDELDSAPPELIRQLSTGAVRNFAIAMQADRNNHRNWHKQQVAKSARLEAELLEAREGCKALRTRIAALVEAARPFNQADLFEENSAYMRAQVTVSVGQLRALALAIKAVKS